MAIKTKVQLDDDFDKGVVSPRSLIRSLSDSVVTKQELNFTDNSNFGLDGSICLPECCGLGLNPTWRNNFGQGHHTNAADAHMLDVLTDTNTLFRMSLALARFAKQGTAVTAAQAKQIFGVAANDGTLLNMTGIATGTTLFIPPTLSVKTVSGTTAANVALTGQADLTTDGDQTLILFNNYIIENGHNLDVETHTNNEHLAAACEFISSGNNDNFFTRHSATTDGHQNIILTATGDTTILPGSFIYLNAGADSDELAIKGCIRSTGGTIAATYAA